jgi:BirA family biotin operon repressor/biotin-[acetyl-CoA-carboxylase] ligase
MTTKEQLLLQLRHERDGWVSGEALGEALGISRAAISKQIGVLRRDGYAIEASTKKGYRLVELSGKLLGVEIQQGLRTRVLGKELIEYHELIDSTNSRAEQLAAEGAREGALVVAEGQRLGKGRRGRVWYSPPGEGLYFSLVLRPQISPQDAPKLNLVASVAVARALEAVTGVKSGLKWPNDVQISGKKVSGILTSMVADMESVQSVVLGIGINVNSKIEDFPEELREKVTSVAIELGDRVQRVELLRSFLEEFEGLYEAFLHAGFGRILKEWRQRASMAGKCVRIELVDGAIEGKVLDVDADGYLIVETKPGQARRIVAGDLTISREPEP